MIDVELSKILFVDIETVPQFATYEQLPQNWQKLWDKKSKSLGFDNAAEAYQRAGIYSEFGKIICIGLGIISKKNGQKTSKIKTIYGDDETLLLKKFCDITNKSLDSSDYYLCGHNGKEFDFPYIARRMLIKGISLPKILDVQGAKQWETRFLDTMQMWRFGDFKSYTSLELLCACFGIETPKDDIDGSQVGDVYWKEHDLKRIANYCSKDVLSLQKVYLAMTSNGSIDNVEYL